MPGKSLPITPPRRPDKPFPLCTLHVNPGKRLRGCAKREKTGTELRFGAVNGSGSDRYRTFIPELEFDANLLPRPIFIFLVEGACPEWETCEFKKILLNLLR